MKYCTNCGEGVEDNIQICPKCGKPIAPAVSADAAQNQAPQMQQAPQGFNQSYPQGQPGVYQQPMYAYDPTDHTMEMDPQDISDNKILAIACYILSWPGMIVALLAARDSKFVGFHLRQMLKLNVLEVLIALITLVLCWTIIVPIAGGICEVVLLVVQIIGFVNTCKGKAKELPIVNAFKFL